MEITMKQITKKLRLEFAQKFLPIGEDLRLEGHTDYEISKSFMDFVKCETGKFYRQQKSPQKLVDIFGQYSIFGEFRKADSKIETIYCDIFYQENIPFDFQYKIGPYRADFLINKKLVFEIDGPMHDKAHDDRRDKYMEKLGYDILRVPAWLASVSHNAVIKEINEYLNK